MLDEFGRTGAHEVDGHPQVVLAPDDHDREAQPATADFLDELPHADAGKIHRHDNAAGRVRRERCHQSFRAIEYANVEPFDGQTHP